ncbi:MAG: ABC transporter ATP-binding protein [Candidatus Rokubacteria bacterium]|nr:ABC transporter ATP-binding protein [Candidatus Rokubacteria bacterium]
MLEVEAIHVGYGPLQVLWGVSVGVKEGEVVSVIGPNGAGKTTLIKTIVGLLRPRAPDGGRITFRGRRLDRLAPEEIVRQGIAVVPEGARVFPEMSVLDNLRMGALVPRARGRRAQTLAEVFALFPRLEERAGQPARTLSGGERQMLAVGRALMACPALLLLDEPSLGLQPTLVKAIMETIRRINERGITVLLIEQNVHFSLPMSHRAYVLEHGRIVLEGPGAELLRDPHVRVSYLGI